MTNDEWRMTKAALLLVALWAAVASLPAAAPSPTFLGVVDDHGRLTPIAVYDGSEWWNRWPWASQSAEIRALPIPASLAGIPPEWLPPGITMPREWRAFASSRGFVSFRALRLERPPEDSTVDTVVITTTYPAVEPRHDGGPVISGPGSL